MQLPRDANRRHLALVLAIVAGLAGSSPALAQWKWRDGRGQIHVSDLPPPRDVPDKDVLQRPEVIARKPVSAPMPAPAASAASAAAPAKAAVDPELEAKRQRAEQEQATRAKADERRQAELRKDNCNRAREQLALLDSGTRIARVNADGEREIIDDDQRARETQRARNIVASDCR
jgi:hypothetical protein